MVGKKSLDHDATTRANQISLSSFDTHDACRRKVEFELLSLDGVKRKAPHVKTANFKPNNKKTENVVFFFKYMIQIIYNSIRTRSCIV